MNTQLVQTLTEEEQALLNELHSAQDSERTNFYETATPAEWAKVFEEWADSHEHGTPLLSDEAISRESMYGDRG